MKQEYTIKDSVLSSHTSKSGKRPLDYQTIEQNITSAHLTHASIHKMPMTNQYMVMINDKGGNQFELTDKEAKGTKLFDNIERAIQYIKKTGLKKITIDLDEC